MKEKRRKAKNNKYIYVYMRRSRIRGNDKMYEILPKELNYSPLINYWPTLLI